MLFTKKSAVLIDFDLARSVASKPPPTYPLGYNVAVEDGARAPGAAQGKEMQLAHDRFSLAALCDNFE